MALGLLALGEAAVGAARVPVAIEVRDREVRVLVDGAEHVVAPTNTGGWQRIRLEQPGPLEREYQVDGTDTTATQDRDRAWVNAMVGTPLYAVLAWLRDESSYSRWEDARLVSLDDGSVLAEGTGAVEAVAELPARFRVEANLRRPEAAARMWLVGDQPPFREGLELDRDRRNARWLMVTPQGMSALPRWFFPEQPLPFAASLFLLLGRSAAACFFLCLAVVALARGLRRAFRAEAVRIGGNASGVVAQAVLAGWVAVAMVASWRLYGQMPHILDAVSYVFQANVFRSGALWAEIPPLSAAFKGPFQVMWQGHWFSQYPPGASVAYALGGWLAGPLAGVTTIALTAYVASRLFGSLTGLAALVLGATSPFLLFQSGSFLSHPIAGAVLAGALACFVRAQTHAPPHGGWYVASGALLGLAALTREAASLLFALPLLGLLVYQRHWRALLQTVLGAVPAAVLYLAYNTALTGSPLLLPRFLFDPNDRFGFGDGIGFHLRHTLAAGLVNADELLTLLQFDLFGWPPLATFGLLLTPFLLGRARHWDIVVAAGFLLFVAAYVAYFYHGIALGPRYYYEALPWLILLAASGLQHLASFAREFDVRAIISRAAVGIVMGGLLAYSVLFYMPRQLERRAGFSGLPNGRDLTLAFVEPTLSGPRLVGVPDRSLVFTDDWWLFNTALAPLNCGRLDDCPTVFALASSSDDRRRLAQLFPDRVLLRTAEMMGVVRLQPAD